MSETLPAGRAVLGLLPAAAAVVREWARQTQPGAPGLDAAVGRLRDALAETGSPAHRIEMYTPRGTPAALAARVAQAVAYARRDGEMTVVTMGGVRAALLLPATRAQGRVTPGLVRELASADYGTRAAAVISRDKGGGFRVEARGAAKHGGREVIADGAELAAWAGRDGLTDEGCGKFAAAVTRTLGRPS